MPDLVVANQNGNTVSVLLGYGDGTFTPAANYFAGSIPRLGRDRRFRRGRRPGPGGDKLRQ